MVKIKQKEDIFEDIGKRLTVLSLSQKFLFQRWSWSHRGRMCSPLRVCSWTVRWTAPPTGDIRGTKRAKRSGLVILYLLTGIKLIFPSALLQPHTRDDTSAQQNWKSGLSAATLVLGKHLMFMVRFVFWIVFDTFLTDLKNKN